MKLNIGGGSASIPGFTTVDRKNGQEAFPLPHADGTVDEIRASHILEHFSFGDALKALKEWRRVLRPGGRLRVAVPDIHKAYQLRGSDRNWKHYIMGGQVDDDDFHRSLWDQDILHNYMNAAGFENVKGWESDGLDTSSHKVSLNMEGEAPAAGAAKDEAGEPEEVKIAAVMSIPRVGWNDAWMSITDALRPFGIPVRTFGGVFWGQCMQRVMLDAVDDGCDWILALDYDSMITKWHINDMIRIFAENDDVDALVPLQPKRGSGTPLCTAEGKTSLEVTGDTVPITTGHFGCTLIRCDALKRMPLPWFQGVPGPDGKYEGEQKLDEDIWFWQQWREAGNTVHLAPRVSLGHLELLCAQIMPDGSTKHMHINKWREDNRR